MDSVSHAQNGKPDVALNAVKARTRDSPAIGSRKKPEPDLNESAKVARRAGKGEERLLETWEVTCSRCGQEFEVPFKPERTDRPLYGPCCGDREGKKSF